MRKATDFSDITLACEDGRQIYAHRIILASSSSFFQKVLTKVMHSHPLIFLKGVTHSHLSAIMDFIYLGQAEIQEKDLDAFVEVAKDLGIKGMTEQGIEAKERQAMRSVTQEHEGGLASSYIAVNYNTSASAPADVDETDQLIRDPLSLPGIKCDECGKRYSTKASLRSHRYMHKKKKQKSSSQGRKGQEQVGKEGGVKTSEQNGNAMMEVENDNEDHLEEMLTQVDMIMEKEGTGESSGEPVNHGGGSGEDLGSLGADELLDKRSSASGFSGISNITPNLSWTPPGAVGPVLDVAAVVDHHDNSTISEVKSCIRNKTNKRFFDIGWPKQ